MNSIYLPAAIVVLFTSLGFAESIPFSFSGTVDEVLNSPPAPFSAAEAGDTFRVDYVLDISTPDLDGIDDLGTFSGAIESYTVTIGGVAASTDLGGVNTANSGPFSPEDTYAVVGWKTLSSSIRTEYTHRRLRWTTC